MIQNTGIFSASAPYNLKYLGMSANTGLEASGSGLHDLTINLALDYNQIIMESDLTVNGTMSLINGKFNIGGYILTLNGPYVQTPDGMFVGTITSDLILNSSTAFNDSIRFYGGYEVLEKLTLNIAGGKLTLASPLTIYEELNMASGKLELSNYDLIVTNGGTIINYSDNSYIVTSGSGKLSRNVNVSTPYVAFPVGTASSYSPAFIQQTSSGTAGMFMVNTMDGVYANGTSGFNSANITSVVDRTWNISASGGVVVNSNIRLGWKDIEEVNGFDRTNAYISNHNGASWDLYATSSALSGPFSTYELMRTGVTGTGPFSVADQDAVLTVPDADPIIGFSIYPNPANDFVMIQNSGTTNFRYELIDVSGKSIVTLNNNTTTNYFDLKQVKNGCYFIKATNLDSKQVITKKFIKG